ncbi:MAG: YidC/Oxa1 family membrane protein insertase [Pseudomonadota bacterium]
MWIFATVLSPIVWLMEWLLGLFTDLTGSVGVAIILLSGVMSLALTPFRRLGKAVEDRISVKMKAANEEVAEARKTLKGEKLFLATEKIYQRHGYHPIQSVALGASFLVMLPVLISAIILFQNTPLTAGEAFLFIPDLQQPDGVLWGFNLLPAIMSAVTIVDAAIRFRDDRSAQLKFYFLAAVLFALVYGLPSALVLYWTFNNFFAFATSVLDRKRD